MIVRVTGGRTIWYKLGESDSQRGLSDSRRVMLIRSTDESIQLKVTTSGSLHPGGHYELICNATDKLTEFFGLPKIYWTGNGANVTSDASQGVEVGGALKANGFVSRALILDPLRQSLAGQYRCVAVQPQETTYVEETIALLGKGRYR